MTIYEEDARKARAYRAAIRLCQIDSGKDLPSGAWRERNYLAIIAALAYVTDQQLPKKNPLRWI